MLRCYSLLSEAFFGLLWKEFEQWLVNETLLTNLNDLILSLSDSLKNKDSYLTKQKCQDIKNELKGLDPLWLEFVESLGITGKYYIMFIEMAQIMKRYVKSERIGNWDGHLLETENIVP